MSTNHRATFSKRQRELAQKDRAADRAARRTERRARAADRAAAGQVGPPMGAPISPDDLDLPPPEPIAERTEARGRISGNRLYVGNLSFNTDAEEIRALFATVGEVTDVQLVTDRYTGRPRGFAFVSMSSDAEAQKAISELDGKVVDNRPLRVSAKDK